jgi:hypothetical protein
MPTALHIGADDRKYLGCSQEQPQAAQQAGGSRQCGPGSKPRLSSGSGRAFNADPKINKEFGLTPSQLDKFDPKNCDQV